MRIAKNVEMLEITTDQGAFYPVLIWEDGQVVLIDTGLPGQMQLFRAAIGEAGFAPEQVGTVMLTHQDMDHIGCARAFAELGAQIWAHEAEAPYIAGAQTPVKIAAMERRWEQLSEAEQAFCTQVKAHAGRFQVPVDRLLRDGEGLPLCGGIEVIHTPGHTPGHIALLLEAEGILVAGDAANIEGGRLVGADPAHTQDLQQAQQSFEKLQQRKPRAVVCYHGGLLSLA